MCRIQLFIKGVIEAEETVPYDEIEISLALAYTGTLPYRTLQIMMVAMDKNTNLNSERRVGACRERYTAHRLHRVWRTSIPQ